MCAFPGTGTLCQDIYSINPADLTQSIYFLPPAFISIGKIIPICIIVMIIKIKYKEIACLIRQHWIDADHV